MKILVVSQYFWPENFKVNDLCIELKKQGNEVYVLTGKPNYPDGNYFKGYKFSGYSIDNYNDIVVNRVPMLPRRNGSNINLILNYFSFLLFACFFVLFDKKKYDMVFSYAVSPITSVIPGILVKFFYKTKFYIWIQDLWPESAYVNNRIKNSFIKYILNKIVSIIYKNSDKIFIQAESMRIPIKKKLGNNYLKSNVIFLPNWAEDFYYNDIVENNKYSKLIPLEKFVVLFAGNIGSGIDIKSIIKTISLLVDNDNIKFIFIGGGSEKKYFHKKINELNLNKNVVFIKRYPPQEMPYFYKLADLLFTSFRDDEIYSYTLPSKIPTYMASGKPLIAMANGQTSITIKEANCGQVVPSGDYKQLASKIELLSKYSKEELKILGENGKKYSKEIFNKYNIVNKILNS